VAPEIVAEIKRRLAAIEVAENVSIPLAIESGSRAWGFPSPDSDYDCRFVYVRKKQDLLTLFPKRDVIETELTPVFDVNGWELAKALKLMLKGNALIIEWLQSPITYIEADSFRKRMLAFSETVFDRGAIARHYFHLLKVTYDRHLSDPDTVSLKKLFYILRPAIALTYMREVPEVKTLPMQFQHLCKAVTLPSGLLDVISTLLDKKAVTREMGVAAAPKLVLAFLRAELERGEVEFAKPSRRDKRHDDLADAFYREMLEAFAPS
jgi:uncharacterized protein